MTSYKEFMQGLQITLDAPTKPVAHPLVASEAEFDMLVSPDTIRDLRSALLSMRSCERELWIRMGIALKTIGDQGRGIWLDWSATSDKFDPRDAADTWETFRPSSTNYAAVFAEAQRNGWVNPASHAAPEFEAVGYMGNLEQNLVAFDTEENPFDDLPHVVANVLPCDEVTLMGGHGGGGKSYVALLLCVHVVLGLMFAGLATFKTKVLFFSAEDGKRVLLQRLAKICRVLGIDPATLEGKLFILDASDIDPSLYREQRGRQSTETELLGSLSALVEKLGVGFVIIDNASDAFAGNEISRSEVRAFVRSLRQRLARPGRAVLLLAHINKASANMGRQAGSEDYSGSTAWHNSVRSRLSLSPDGENGLKIEHMKANNGAKAAPIRLAWVNGVPMAGSHTDAGAVDRQAAARVQDDADKALLVALIQGFDKRGERVTTSSQGSATVFRLLKGQAGFPKATDSERLMRLLRELESDGGIFRRIVRTPDRKHKEVFTCAPIVESAPIPNVQAVGVQV